MEDLSLLPNIGAVTAKELKAIGVESYADLKQLGSIETAIKLKFKDPSVCLNKLYGLEGAIRGVRWHSIPKAERAELKARYEAALKEAGL